MKTFFSNAWKWLAVFFAGIIAGLVAAMKLSDKPTVTNITAETYVAEQHQETKIGKVKQRGDGNLQDVDQSPVSTAKEKRKAKRQENRARKREQHSKPATDDEVQRCGCRSLKICPFTGSRKKENLIFNL